MKFLDDSLETLDGTGQEIHKHAGYVGAEMRGVIETVGQELGKRVDPAALCALNSFGEEAGKHVGATADDIWQALLGAKREAEKHIYTSIEHVSEGFNGLEEVVEKHMTAAIADAKTIDSEKPAHAHQAMDSETSQANFCNSNDRRRCTSCTFCHWASQKEEVLSGSMAAGVHSSIGNVPYTQSVCTPS